MAASNPRLLGTRLNLYLGDERATPAPALLMEALQDVEIELGDEGNDGFQITFGAGRRSGIVSGDSPVFEHPLLTPFSRVVVQVSVGPQVFSLIDGFITQREANPGDAPGTATLTVTGEDIRVMMDVEERAVNHFGLSPDIRVLTILTQYARYFGLPPRILPARFGRIPNPREHIPVQSTTDLQYVQSLARDHAHVFYVEPGDAPNTNYAYWGPPIRVSQPQPALNVNMGPDSNARIRFAYDSLKPESVDGAALDPLLRILEPVIAQAAGGSRLASKGAREFQRGILRKRLARNPSGRGILDALNFGNAAAERSNNPLTATAEVDMAAYGHVLKPRRLVGVRGAGRQLDGLYYVKRVTHAIRRGAYQQQCTLEREGIGRLVEVLQ
jgi:hypothetical protein